MLRPSQYADLQSNAPLALAKRLGMPPREVAAKIVAALAEIDGEGTCGSVETSGPGFVNLTLSDTWIASGVTALGRDEIAEAIEF